MPTAEITMKTLILSALRSALNIKTKILILLLALTCFARATFIETGRITLSGDFTLNHLYDFHNQTAQPFGSFGTQTASQVTGIFSPFVQNGNILSGSTALWTLPSGGPVWTIGGFTLTTTFDLISGPDLGRFCFGILDMTGKGTTKEPIMFIGSLLLRRTTSRTLTTTLQARSACLSEWDSTTAMSLMAGRQFLCSVSVCWAWLPAGAS